MCREKESLQFSSTTFSSKYIKTRTVHHITLFTEVSLDFGQTSRADIYNLHATSYTRTADGDGGRGRDTADADTTLNYVEKTKVETK